MRILAALLLSAALPLALAAPPQVGQTLPSLTIEDKGELILAGDHIEFHPWQSDQLPAAMPQVIQYLAARLSTSKINEPFTDALSVAGLDAERYRVTTIINLDEALWGTSGFVIRELEKNKREHPHAVMVVDANGRGRATWDLEPANSAIILLNEAGTVQFFKQGALSEAEIEEVLGMLRAATTESP